MSLRILISKILIVLVLLIAAGCGSEQQPAATTDAAESGPQYVSIFNGQNLDGWKYDRIEADTIYHVFSIEDGELILDTPGTDEFVWLTYDKELTDFSLRLKFMAFQDRVGNCGIQFRDHWVDINFPRHGFDLASNVPQSTGFIWDFTEHWLPYPMEGYNADNFLPYLPEDWEYRWSTDPNPWNEFEVSVIGSRVKTVLNGKTIIDWDGGEKIKPSGYMAIEVHRRQDFMFRFKDIELMEL